MEPTLSTYLNARLLGQQEAVYEFSMAVTRAENGPVRPGRTRAFILLLGPTGTGKTEMVKLTTQFLYGQANSTRLARFDMAEYQHRDSIGRFLGCPGQPALLGEAIDKLNAQGGGILLLDEIEKAYPDLLTVLLSFDDARTTMADGSTKDLSRCYVVMTSNLGAAEAAKMTTSGYSAVRRKVIREAEAAMRKETFARFSASIVMNVLTFEVQREIAQALMAKELAMQSAHLRRPVFAGEDVLTFLVGKGFSPDLGARNIRNTVERFIGNAMLPFYGASSRAAIAHCTDMLSMSLTLHVKGDALEARAPERSAELQALISAA